jgi:PEP-CTERM motif
MGKVMRLNIRRTLCPLLVANFLASEAAADPYTILPNGDLIFNTSVTTTGNLSCFQLITCTQSGSDALTLWVGAEWLTFKFTGASVTAGVGNVTVPFDLGTIEGTSSPGFQFPPSTNSMGDLFFFTLSILQSSPIESIGRVGWGTGTALSRHGGGTYAVTSAGPNPPGYDYPIIVYTMRESAFQLSSNGTTELIADVGAVPEPATLVLLGTGLAGLFARRRKQHLAGR